MARSGATVRISGIERLKGRLEDLPEEIREALARAVKESAEAVQSDTKRDVRIDERGLIDNVDIRYDEDGLIATVGWFEDEHYYARYHEFGTRRFPAQPALHPALEAERSRYRARLTEEVRRVLR
ncbi:HK97-gp10 family putative phage morphogenesis protein [Streptomyces sp. NPDC048389]|uniref:HK97-gp10 family putative phage morphogenesis protein n=1 Tax=Streptomyces sp. NPDC048389 TaxID=3154622 RepID=UPI00345328B3